MLPAITSVYAALLAFLFVGLSVRVIRSRRRNRIAIGDGDNPALRRATRVHANFAEYVPLALILIAFVEISGGSPWIIHIMGGGLLAGRILHSCGVSRQDENFRFRVAGMSLTFAVTISCALLLLGFSLLRF